jgi:hypothetical protein
MKLTGVLRASQYIYMSEIRIIWIAASWAAGKPAYEREG